MLLARLAIDPHAGFSADSQQRAIAACCCREVQIVAKSLNQMAAFGYTNEVLRVLLTSESIESQSVMATLCKHASDLSLKALDLNETGIRDVSSLSQINGLQYLYLTHSAVSDLSPLSALKNLRKLDLDRSAVSNLGPISGLSELRELWIQGTPVSDLTPVASLKNMTSLVCSNSSIADLRPLAELRNLRDLWISGTSVSDLSPLIELGSLEKMGLKFTSITGEQVEEFQLARRQLGHTEVEIQL